VQSPVVESFRVRQVSGLFDVPLSQRSVETFSVELPGLDEAWALGAIVGPSGSGKSTVAAAAYEQGRLASGALVRGFDWPDDRAVVDGFDEALDGRAITGMLNAVGFSSPPAWVRPWRVLSNGQRFRCDLARALLSERELVVFDEFTSVVDRQVARFGSAAVARTIRAGRARCKRFVAVTCHYDVLEWLQPDWWLDMSSGALQRGSLQRPPIELEIRHCRRELWRTFGRHHYLSAQLNAASRCYAALWNDAAIGFCATMPLYGHKGCRIVHRLVVLPDYQGLGVGLALLNAVATHETRQSPLSIVTSHPALIRALARHALWRCASVTRCGLPHAGLLARLDKKVGSIGRTTASFRFRAGDRLVLKERPRRKRWFH
jgi:GNAT superfamily N-acetyltransferase/ABC-type ATPase involved in cell division